MFATFQSFTPTITQAWILLAIAIGFEVAGTTCMKLSHGLTNWPPALAMLGLYAIAFLLNAKVTKTLELGMTYAVWSGVGTAITAAIGIFYFRESVTTIKMVSMGLILIGVMGLHTASRADLG